MRRTHGAFWWPLILAIGACGTKPTSEPEVSMTTSALTSSVTGSTTASPARGTSLPLNSTATPVIAPGTAVNFRTPLINVPGMSNATGISPPDTNGDVGPNHFVQMVNSTPGGSHFTVYDKSGTPVSSAVSNVPLGQLVNTTGACATGVGDPLVNYDRQANRWIMLQIGSSGSTDPDDPDEVNDPDAGDSGDPDGGGTNPQFPNRHLCIYVSDGGDPTALDHWALYDFDLGAMTDASGNPAPGGFPDYPHLAIWPDAYYVTTNDLDPNNQVGVYALQRSAMLAGTTAAIQRFVIPSNNGPSAYQPATPADLDSARLPPAGAPGMIIRRSDDEIDNPPGNPNQDQIEIWNVHADFTTPANSTLTGPTIVATADFNINVCSLFLFADCADQPTVVVNGTPITQRLSDVGSLVVPWRVQYRNFGDHESLVGDFDVNDGAGNPEPHWFELRRTGGLTGSWSLVQEQTYKPNTNDRWMGGISMDQSGNIALGYSLSSTTLFPGINYTGRQSTDALGNMTVAEATIAVGGGAQIGSDRWGDYSAMNVDPNDDCTFWYTTEYYATTSATGWATRIAAFRFPFPACFPPADVCVRTTNSLAIRDRAQVNRGTLANGVLANSGPVALTVGVNGVVADVLSASSVSLADRAAVNGLIQTGGTLSRGNQTTVSGTITQNSAPTLPPPIDISGVVFPPTTVDVTVPNNQQLSRPPGGYHTVTVFAGGRLLLTTGRYFFDSLDIEPTARVQVDETNGPVLIFVRTHLTYHGRIALANGQPATVFLGYLGSDQVTLTDLFNGTLVAPAASLSLGSDGQLSFRGQFVARNFELTPASVLTCDSSATADL